MKRRQKKNNLTLIRGNDIRKRSKVKGGGERK
jgi:hypothetical protein